MAVRSERKAGRRGDARISRKALAGATSKDRMLAQPSVWEYYPRDLPA